MLDPNDFVIARKRKKYRFAVFANSPLCFEVEEWSSAFSPTVMEMGAGTALFSVAMAESSRESQFVAVDVKADRLQTGAGMAEEKGLNNLRFLRARASQLPEILTPHSLEKIWITFPDPFPKDRSAKHRLTHPTFLSMYRQLLKSDGALYFKTDAKALFEWSLEQLVAHRWQIEELSFDLHDSELPDNYKVMTSYEKRFTDEGIKINFVKATPR